jgi:hypothetical protein
MKIRFSLLGLIALITLTLVGCGRYVRTAEDITPGNVSGEKLDWHYGAGDIRIQTTKLSRVLMDRWFAKTGYDYKICKPRIVITEVDNRTDCYISTDMVRDIFEGVAVDDGRYTIVVGNYEDTAELDQMMLRIQNDPKYNNSSRFQEGQATAPQFLAKVRITKADNADRFFVYEDYRMTVTLYDIQTQEIVDSAWDVLSKRVRR